MVTNRNRRKEEEIFYNLQLYEGINMHISDYTKYNVVFYKYSNIKKLEKEGEVYESGKSN